MYYDINRTLVEEKMREMRKYASDSNLNEKKRKKVQTVKKQRAIQSLRSRKVG